MKIMFERPTPVTTVLIMADLKRLWWKDGMFQSQGLMMKNEQRLGYS